MLTDGDVRHASTAGSRVGVGTPVSGRVRAIERRSATEAMG